MQYTIYIYNICRCNNIRIYIYVFKIYKYIYIHTCIYHSSISPEFSQGSSLSQELPSYARPRFLRFLSDMDVTGTFKHQKADGWCRRVLCRRGNKWKKAFLVTSYIYFYSHFIFTRYRYIWYIFLCIIYVLYIWEFFHLVLKEGFLSPKMDDIWFDPESLLRFLGGVLQGPLLKTDGSRQVGRMGATTQA